MKHPVRRALASAAAAITLFVTACATSPLGRNQLILFPDAEMSQMGAAAFQEMQQKTPPSSNAAKNAYVRCVADNIIRALPGEQPQAWEVRVFEDDAVNAFALPGRKIGVYTGLLDIAENQDQLATVIGHEVGHVQAQHSNERVSTNFVTQSGLQLVQVAAGVQTPMQQQLFGLLGLGVQVGVLLPFNRTQEAEADLIGLDLMADAGFDPRQAAKLWQNMASKGGPSTPEFLSTHPSSERRIAELSARASAAFEKSLAGALRRSNSGLPPLTRGVGLQPPAICSVGVRANRLDRVARAPARPVHRDASPARGRHSASGLATDLPGCSHASGLHTLQTPL